MNFWRLKKVNVARCAHNVECDFFLWFSNTVESGNTVWPQVSGFQKLVKLDHFRHFLMNFFPLKKRKHSSVARNVLCDFFLWFSNTVFWGKMNDDEKNIMFKKSLAIGKGFALLHFVWTLFAWPDLRFCLWVPGVWDWANKPKLRVQTSSLEYWKFLNNWKHFDPWVLRIEASNRNWWPAGSSLQLFERQLHLK